jgi:hypothetical protein
MIPNSPDALLTRDATANALTESGFPTASPTLATKATRGGGPPFRRFGRRPLYRWGDALEWAESRLSERIRSTLESDSSPLTEPKSSPIVDVRCGSVSEPAGGAEGTALDCPNPGSAGFR